MPSAAGNPSARRWDSRDAGTVVTSTSEAGKGQAVSRFALSLRSFKERCGKSYRQLAKRSLISTAALHRYCTGEAVPPDFTTVFRLVKALGATRNELAMLHQQWLAARVAIEDLSSKATAAVIAQLPERFLAFRGRQDELIAVERALLTPAGSGAPAAVLIHGAAGTGKSALAVEAAHRLVSRFPHGQLYVDLRATSAVGHPLPTVEAIGGLLSTLGVAGHAPAVLEQAASALRRALARMQVLIVLDDAADTAQAQPLLQAMGKRTVVVITSRDPLTGLAVAERIQLRSLAAGSGTTPPAVAVIAEPAPNGNVALARHGIRPGGRLASRTSTLHRDPPRNGIDDRLYLTEPADDTPAQLVPRQLPTVTRHFVGRHGEVLKLHRLAPICAITGPAGIGKTTLALRWAHEVADQFPDGQLYLDLRGFDPAGQPVPVDEAVVVLLDALGVASAEMPSTVEARIALLRTRMAGRRLLLVFDNVRDAGQIRPLLPGHPSCVAVITSRNRLASLVAIEDAQVLTLDVLSRAEAEQMLAHRTGRDRVRADPVAVEAILTHCAGLPLALSVVGARIATHPGLGFAQVAEELDSAHSRLDALTNRDPVSDIRAVFSWSYNALSTATARLFRLLGLHPGPDISVAAAASLAGMPIAAVTGSLGELSDANLLDERARGRFAFHDLLRAYAAELALDTDKEVDHDSAVGRMLDYYLHSSHAAAMALQPHRDSIALTAPDRAISIESPNDVGEARAWFDQERKNLLDVIELASATGLDQHIWQLAWSLEGFFSRSGLWHDWIATQTATLVAMKKLGDLSGQARAHRSIGTAYIRTHRHQDAHRHLSYARDLFDELGDTLGLAHTHYHLSRVCEVQTQHQQMLDHGIEALRLFRATGHSSGQARALGLLGWQQTLSGAHHQALALCEEALTILIRIADRRPQADAWDSLGHANHHLGDFPRAVVCYEKALELYREYGARYLEAKTLLNLGDTRDALLESTDARSAWKHAMRILDELGHPDLEQVRHRLTRNVDGTRQNTPHARDEGSPAA